MFFFDRLFGRRRPEAAQAPMAEWRAKAETRQAALAALAELAGKIGG